MKRPEILTVHQHDVTDLCSTITYSCEHLDVLWSDFRTQNTKVGSIILYDAGDSLTIPGKVFELFDWVICQYLPHAMWRSGIVHTWKHSEMPDVKVKRRFVTFFGGFEPRPMTEQQPYSRTMKLQRVKQQVQSRLPNRNILRKLQQWKMPKGGEYTFAIGNLLCAGTIYNYFISEYTQKDVLLLELFERTCN